MKELNLVPYVIRQKKSKSLKNKTFIYSGLVIAAVLLTGYFVPRFFLWNMESELVTQKQEIEKGKPTLEASDKIKQEIDDLKKYTDKVELVSKEKIIVSDIVKNLQKYIAKDMTLQVISYSNGVMTLNGTAKSYNSIPEFGANLQLSKEYKQTTISDIKLDLKAGIYNFKITVEGLGGVQDEKSK